MYYEFSFLLLLLLLLWHVINNLVLPNNTKCALPLVLVGEEGRAGGEGRSGELELRHAMRQKLHCECGSGCGCGRGSGRSLGRSAEWEIGSRHTQTHTHMHAHTQLVVAAGWPKGQLLLAATTNNRNSNNNSR